MSHELDKSEAVGEELVPAALLPPGKLPPLRYRDLPEPIGWRKMLGPSLMLAGLGAGLMQVVSEDVVPYIYFQF